MPSILVKLAILASIGVLPAIPRPCSHAMTTHEIGQSSWNLALVEDSSVQRLSLVAADRKEFINKNKVEESHHEKTLRRRAPVPKAKSSEDLKKLSDKELNDWIKMLTDKQSAYKNLADAFCLAVRSSDNKPLEKHLQTVPSELKDYLEFTIQKPLVASGLTKDDSLKAATIIVGFSINISNQLSDALMAKMLRAFE